MSMTREWDTFQEDVDKFWIQYLLKVLKESSRSCPQSSSVGHKRFGGKDKKDTPKNKPNRGEERVVQIRKELRILRSRWKNCQEIEKVGIKQLRDDLREKLKWKRRAEYYRKKRKKKEKARQRFIDNPHKFTSDLLGKPKSGTPESTLGVKLKDNLKATHSDMSRESELGNCENLLKPEDSKVHRSTTKGRELQNHQTVPHHLTTQCRRQDVFFYNVSQNDNLHAGE